MVKVSVVLPVYNVAGYLPKCLDSLINQTLSDIEIICVNDASTDNSLDVLHEYAKKDSRIRVIDQPNAGPGKAKNNGIAAAQGEYVAFVDPDDWVDLDMYEKLYAKAQQEKADVVECNVTVHEEKNSKVKYKKDLYETETIDVKEKPALLFSGILAS